MSFDKIMRNKEGKTRKGEKTKKKTTFRKKKNEKQKSQTVTIQDLHAFKCIAHARNHDAGKHTQGTKGGDGEFKTNKLFIQFSKPASNNTIHRYVYSRLQTFTV